MVFVDISELETESEILGRAAEMLDELARIRARSDGLLAVR